MKDLHMTSAAVQSRLRIPSACPQSPIFAVQLRRPRDLSQYLQLKEMMIRAVVPPTVPHGTQRVRICLHAGNTTDEVRKLVRALQEWCEEQTGNIEDAEADPERENARL
jgi:8-amino-7-oxononanoate synthase